MNIGVYLYICSMICPDCGSDIIQVEGVDVCSSCSYENSLWDETI